MKVLWVRKRNVHIIASFFIVVIFLVILFIFIKKYSSSFNNFKNIRSQTIIIDPGHGGIDGGATIDGMMEKDINLAISLKLKDCLELKGYTVLLTRTQDVALDNLDKKGVSRHQRDLNARVHLINESNAQLFLSIHANCNLKKPTTEGAIVFYSDKFEQTKALANCMQQSLNAITVDSYKRTAHRATKGNYFLLRYSKITGVIIETGFLSNSNDRILLMSESFRDKTAAAITEGVDQYFGSGI